jgi:hypothetical protein
VAQRQQRQDTPHGRAGYRRLTWDVTAHSTFARDRWTHRRPVVAAIALALTLTCGSLAGLAIAVISPEQPARLAAPPVPAWLRQPVTIAALSCPTLTPARLAGQVMAASRFDPNAITTDGGMGVAGLTEAAWQRWAPRPGIARTDVAATVLALAHDMCDLVGELRAAKVPGDRWRLALAAYQCGTLAVISAHKVPPAAAGYVDRVAGYAAWYEAQESSLSPSASVVPAAAGTGSGQARSVPAADLPLILAAGKICPQVTPSRIAGQLMAASGFQANLLGPAGAQGIAQFLPEIWAQYAPSGSGSPWDPGAAIPTLATAMCDLVDQLTPLGADPYRLALAAFRWGPVPVRQAGAVPGTADIQAYVNAVLSHADAYATDPALSAGWLVSPNPSPSPSRTPTPRMTPSLTPAAPPATSPSARPSPSHWTELTIQATTVLERGQSAQTNRTRLVMENGGDLAIYDENNQRRWHSGTTGAGYRAVFQGDGNLVVYDQNWTGLWDSKTAGRNGAVLVLETDGNVCVVYQAQVIWASNTAH